jgi:hypothetical protein
MSHRHRRRVIQNLGSTASAKIPRNRSRMPAGRVHDVCPEVASPSPSALPLARSFARISISRCMRRILPWGLRSSRLLPSTRAIAAASRSPMPPFSSIASPCSGVRRPSRLNLTKPDGSPPQARGNPELPFERRSMLAGRLPWWPTASGIVRFSGRQWLWHAAMLHDIACNRPRARDAAPRVAGANDYIIATQALP